MTSQGKTLRIYLVDGTPIGIMTIEIINWTGKLLLVPRAKLADLARREEAKRTGVYCMVGSDPEKVNRERVYIGEADNLLSRLKEHDKGGRKEFWTHTILISSKDENITKAHGRYLESRLIQLAGEANRAELENSNKPLPPPLPESDLADMAAFLDQVQMVLPVLGYNFLKPKRTAPQYSDSLQSEERVFVFEYAGAKAHAVESGDELVVLKGSTARIQGTKSWKSYVGLRDQLVKDGKLVPSEDEGYYIFVEDVAFNSPSAAASVVAAHAQNGQKAWILEGTDLPYSEIRERDINQAESNTRLEE